MVNISKRSKKELFIQQLYIQDQLEDYKEFSDAEIDGALIDDSLARFLYLLLDSQENNEEELLTLFAYTKAKYRKMKNSII